MPRTGKVSMSASTASSASIFAWMSLMMAKKEPDDVMGLFVGIDHRVHGVLGGEEKRKKKKINVSG